MILSGPSCVGKTPLSKALKRFYPDLAAKLRPLVLYNSRVPRPGEQSGVDYHFRTREQVEALRGESRYVVLDVRGDLQALDLDDLFAVLQGGDALFEGNPFVGRLLQTHASLGECAGSVSSSRRFRRRRSSSSAASRRSRSRTWSAT